MSGRSEYLTVREVMEYLRLGRTTVYAQARRYLETDGAEGLPCRRFGRSLRFPLAELEGNASPPTEASATTARSTEPSPRSRRQPRQPEPTQTSRPAGTTGPATQSPLPFPG